MVINLKRHAYLVTRANAKGRVWSWFRAGGRDLKNALRYRCFLNGCDVTDGTFYVDSRRGIVRRYLRNADGKRYLNADRTAAAWREDRGRVRLVRREAAV